jgi:hypothetical protein
MTSPVARLRKEISRLKTSDREALARLLEFDRVLAPATEKIDRHVQLMWDITIRSSISHIESGNATLIPLSQVEADTDIFLWSLWQA